MNFFRDLVSQRRPYLNLRVAVPVHKTPTDDKEMEWDGDAAEELLRQWASSDGSGEKETIDWEKYKMGFGWYNQEEMDNFGAYKLPHHTVVDDELVLVYNGLVAAMAALNGARAELDVPEEDRPAIHSHLSAHYQQFDEEAPELK